MDSLNDEMDNISSDVNTINLNIRKGCLVMKRELYESGMCVNSQNKSVESDDSFSDSDTDKIDIFELKKRMWKDQILLRKLEGTCNENKHGASAAADQSFNPCQLIRPPNRRLLQPSRKTMLRAEDGVLQYMLRIMQECNARGFVYGILPNTGPPITRSSDSLRAWWKDTVAFDQNAPYALICPDTSISAPVVQDLCSYLHNLEEISDNTIGSILSALIQHCVPPQRSFPFEHGMPPPWWPRGNESWWGLQGDAQAQLGPPPYRKPHDLRKGWKLSLLAAVIKHMSPQFDQLRRLVWQSKRLQRKMSGREVDTWSQVLNQEEALVEQTKRSLVLETLDDDVAHSVDDGGNDMEVTRKRKCVIEHSNVSSDSRRKEKEKCLERDYIFGDLHSDMEMDKASIDELMRLYYSVQEGSSGDLGGIM